MINRPASRQPIPSNAKKVFHGVMFDVYQWEQEQFDGSTKTFEKLKRPDTVVVFPVLQNGNILVSHQEQPGKSAFTGGLGGRMEDGEDPEAAARRELLEESGYEAEELVLWNAQHPTSKIDWVVYTFVAKQVRRVSDQSLDPGEEIELQELSFDGFLDLGLDPTFTEREIVPELLLARSDDVVRVRLKELLSP